MNFIKELYFGNVTPSVKSVIRNSEYSRLMKLCVELSGELKQRLEEKDIEALESLEGANFDLLGITAEENYVFGFRDGAKMMLDILCGESDDLRPLIR